MYNEETISEIREVEQKYQLEPIRGFNQEQTDTARYIRAMAIRTQERATRWDSEGDSDPRKEIRRLAAEMFPIPDAYTIITMARMNPYCENDIMPLEAKGMQPQKNSKEKDIAWRFLIWLEEEMCLPMITNVNDYSNAAATIARINIIRGCREMIKRLPEDKAQPYRDTIERLSRKDVDIKAIREANELIPPRSVYTI